MSVGTKNGARPVFRRTRLKRAEPIGTAKDNNRPRLTGRFYRRVLYGCGLLLLLAVIGVFLATRSFVLKTIARPHIEATFGGEIEIGSIHWLDFDELEINRLVVQAPGWNAMAGEVIRIDRAVIELNASALRTGSFEIQRMEVEGMNFRIAESANQPGRFNVLTLQPQQGSGGDGNPPKRIDIRDFTMEMGVADENGWTKTGEILLSGDLVSQPANRNEFFFNFVSDAGPTTTSTVLKGRIDIGALTFDASMDDLVVTRDLLGMMPVELRNATDSMALEGVIDRLEVSRNEAMQLSASLDLGSASMVIPSIGDQDTWSRLDAGIVTNAGQKPLVKIDSGRLRLEQERLFIEKFKGELTGEAGNTDPIPIIMAFEMDLQDRSNQDVDWSDSDEVTQHVFDVAPFVLDINIPNFEIRSDGAGVILPRAAAQAFSEFGVEQWRVNIRARLKRPDPTIEEDGTPVASPIETNGEVVVDNGTGRYSRFPYPLENVRANIEFDDDLVTITRLIGTGPMGGSVMVEGTIIDPGSAAAIDVSVRGRDVPADRVFRSALDGWRRRTWDRFFDTHAERKLRESGLLSTRQDVERAIKQRTRILKQLSGLDDETEASRQTLTLEAERLDRIIQAGPFQLGGVFSFDLKVTSPAGENQPVFLTGDIDITEGNVVVSDFPFPIHLEESRITLTPDDILINDGLFFTTPMGGTGVIRGSIHNPDTPEGADPISVIDVSFAALQVDLTETLLAALPPGGDDEPIDPNTWPGTWRSEAAQALAALGLKGKIDVEGTLRGDRMNPSEDPVLRFQTRLSEGSITPDVELADFFARAGVIWPEGFQLEACTAVLQVDPEQTTLSQFRGERLSGTVEATGMLSRTSDASRLDVDFETLQMEDYLIDFVPSNNQSTVEDLWRRFNPRGIFDARLQWEQFADGRRDSEVDVKPESITLNLNGEDVVVAREKGDILIHPEEIFFEDLELDISGSGYDHGRLLLDGSYGVPQDGRLLVLDGSVQNGKFQSPILEVLFDLIGVQRILETWQELAPSGRFESHFEYRGIPESEGGRVDYAIDVAPESMSVNLDGQRIHASFETGALYIEPGRFELEHLVAQIPAPGTINVNGNIVVDEQIRAELDMTYQLAQLPDDYHAYLPPPVSTALRSIDFAANGPFEMQEARLSAIWDEDDPIDQPRHFAFDTTIDVEQGRFDAGPSFDEFDARISFECTAEHDRSIDKLVKHLTGTIEGDRIDVQGRRIDDFSAGMRLGEDEVFHLEDMFGRIAEGAVSAEMDLNLETTQWDLDVHLEDASLEELSRNRTDPVAEGTVGTVLGRVQVTGLVGDPAAKNGRGMILIQDGQMTNSPLTFSILQISQLMLPVSSSIKLAEIEFTIDGDLMVFDEFMLTSAGLQLQGTGEMSLEDWRIALRLFPRGTIPIFSDIIGSVTGILYAINVTGTLDEPNATIEVLPILGDGAQVKDRASLQQPVQSQNE